MTQLGTLGLRLGDFVIVTGKIKWNFYIGKDGKPTGSLLVITFEATKIAKHAAEPNRVVMRQPVTASSSAKV